MTHNRIDQAIDEMTVHLDGALAQAVKEAVQVVLYELREYTPVDTGAVIDAGLRSV